MDLIKKIGKTKLSDASSFYELNRNFSEKEFGGLVKKIIASLNDYQLKTGDRIIILVPKSVYAIACIYACLLEGYVFIPVDTEMPFARIDRIIEDCQPNLIVCDERVQEKAKEYYKDKEYSDIKTVFASKEYVKSLYDSVVETSSLSNINEKDFTGEECAYMIYTSGSTGLPKGVCVSRNALYCFLSSAIDRAKYDSDTYFLSFFPLHFDPVLMEIFVPWLVGGRVYLYKKFLYINDLIAKLRDNQITDFSCTPNILNMFLADISLFRKYDWSCLRSIWFGGETANISDLKELMDLAPNIRLFNGYGPTEAVVACSLYEVNSKELDVDGLSIGKPFDDAKFLIMNDGIECDEDNQVGELYVGGKQLMLGYWDRFKGIDKSCFNIIGHDLYYKTGDLVYRKNDKYYFVGRVNSIIKYRGYRIHPAEIEKNINEIDEISCSYVFCDEEKKVLKAVIEISKYTLLEEEEWMCKIKDKLIASLPKYMVPESFIIKNELPRTNAGKLDIQTIKSMVC